MSSSGSQGPGDRAADDHSPWGPPHEGSGPGGGANLLLMRRASHASALSPTGFCKSRTYLGSLDTGRGRAGGRPVCSSEVIAALLGPSAGRSSFSACECLSGPALALQGDVSPGGSVRCGAHTPAPRTGDGEGPEGPCLRAWHCLLRGVTWEKNSEKSTFSPLKFTNILKDTIGDPASWHFLKQWGCPEALLYLRR